MSPAERPPAPLALFASGGGSNAQAIIDYAARNPDCTYRPVLLVSDNPAAKALERAAQAGLATAVLDKTQREDGSYILDLLARHNVRYIALAGYLKPVPDAVVAAYARRIVNIHPSLLPKFGGKGMYGIRVHEAVVAARETQSGITIHYVNEHYDEGEIIFQETLAVDPTWDAHQLQAAVLVKEHTFYPQILAALCAALT